MNEGVSVRIRLSEQQAKQFAKIQEFLGARSLSCAVARVALWNVGVLSSALSGDGMESTEEMVSEFSKAVEPMVSDLVRGAVRQSFRRAVERAGVVGG